MKRSLLLVALLALAPSLASGQDVDALRARVDALRERRPDSVPEGTLTSIEYLLNVSTRIARPFPEQSEVWRARAERFLDRAEAGTDPYPEGRGQLLNRAYDASFSAAPQGYAIYLPPDYDPSRSYPLVVMLHGGSSNGNLFLGVVLGNNMDWERYNQFLWNDFTPRWSPDAIVVAPDGVGQVLWRWMGEQDVLEVIDDVVRHYAVDPDRIVLGGLSNGGMGAYAIGSRHAWRFSHVQAMAGAPSWVQYAGGRPTDVEEALLERVSAMSLFENSVNTDFHYYHGTQDPGPMRPAFVRELTRTVNELDGVPANEHWYEHGHDLLYIVHRHGRIYPQLAAHERDRRPNEVRVVTGDYRANRQHWVTVTRIEDYPRLARVRATASATGIEAETERALEVAFDLRDAPVGDGDVSLRVDGNEIYAGPRAHLGHVVHAHRGDDGWALGFLPALDGLEKRPGLSGPITDAYHDEIVHVFGTADPDARRVLERAANRGANGYPSGTWYLNQRVVADTDVTPEMMRSAHLALYGSPGTNAVLDRIASALPIRAEGDAIVMDDGRRFTGRDVGATFVYPNPEAPGRYVLVYTGVSPQAVEKARNLPDFLPDYVVYDRSTTSSRPRLTAGRNQQLAAGFFDRAWSLPPADEGGSTAAASDESARALPPGITAAEMRELAIRVGAPPGFILPEAVLTQTPPSQLEPGPVPSDPRRPRRFLAPRSDPNGPIARRIAAMVPTFLNYRAVVGGGVWHVDRRAVFQIRAQDACLETLDDAEIPYRAVTEDLRTPIATPVEITGPVNGVRFTTVREGEPIVLACEMAARLPLFTRIVRRHGVRSVAILSSHRTRPRQSFHTLGMALDIYSFGTRAGALVVNDHFVETPAHTTCDAPEPNDRRAATLLSIACDLAETRRFNTILTPNYNDGHRNHFHLDIRPDDDRVFVR